MTTFVHSYCSRHVLCLDHREYGNIRELKTYLQSTKGVPVESCFLLCNGALVDDDDPVQENVVYHTYLRIVGGKGGFGSMLRAIGAQIEKTTNHEACRDLSGRRMRDVNVEKDLKDWLAKKAERDSEKEQRRQDRMARRRAMPHHKFDDPLYEKQRELISQNQDDALQKGLKKATVGNSTSGKRKAETTSSVNLKKKKGTEWLGVDMDMSDVDSEEDSSESSDSQGPSQSVCVKLEPSTSDGASNDSSDSQGPSVSVKLEPATSETPSTDSQGASTFGMASTSDKPTQITNPQVKTEKSDVEVKGEVNIQEVKSEVTEPMIASNKEDVSDDIKGPTESVTPNAEVDCDTGSVCESMAKPFCLDAMSSLEEVQTYGMDMLKAELMSRGLKCGGTLEQRAERLFSVKGLTSDEIDPSFFAKSNGKNVKKKK